MPSHPRPFPHHPTLDYAVSLMSDDEWDAWIERAAILEADGMPRSAAEMTAGRQMWGPAWPPKERKPKRRR